MLRAIAADATGQRVVRSLAFCSPQCESKGNRKRLMAKAGIQGDGASAGRGQGEREREGEGGCKGPEWTTKHAVIIITSNNGQEVMTIEDLRPQKQITNAVEEVLKRRLNSSIPCNK